MLRALEHIAAKIVRLEAEEHDTISFDANSFKALRARELKLAAETAAERVRSTSQPYSFSPMSSRERRMLHLAFRDYADLETESSGEGLRRFVVVYPKGADRPRSGHGLPSPATPGHVRRGATRLSRAECEAPCSPIPTSFTKTRPSLPSRHRPAAAVSVSFGSRGLRRRALPSQCCACATPWPMPKPVLRMLLDLDTQEKLDEAVVTFFAAPHSYTGEDVVEVAAHGSPIVLEALVRQALQSGARLAAPGEFTQRAFLGGRIDLTQAEAVHDLIEAQTLYQARVAAQQLHGALSRRIKPIKEGLVSRSSPCSKPASILPKTMWMCCLAPRS